jgi:hypothetical protein
MRDDQRRNQDGRDEGFEDSLDDLFGDTPDEKPAAAEPVESTPRAELEPAQVHPAPPGDRPTGRSLRRIGCIAIGAVVGGIMLCLVILAIIGFIVGDQSTPTPVV